MQREMAAHISHEAGSATVHYSSRCEKFVLATFLSNSQEEHQKISSVGSVTEKKYEGCPKSLASYFFKNRKMVLKRYPAVII